ncbi:competence protein CoiA family protein [Streptomyces olivochromogenes]|uniref:competence protein CoiA family protein n=1 Tax=Streptomyces olivochromogenes TaxID=1963 RepID=UPI001F34B907|nr:RNA methyltransferase [Streptomyces olivochromogenes]MCF3136835.1 RNA methyltransferase [Streptomyces olivochromogenes]
MAFRAVHAQWGTVFAHLPDLGCGRSWGQVWRVRPPAPLTCDECQHPMHAKRSPSGLRFFAHAPGAPECALAGETLAHHLLKLELAAAARDAGAHAELEVRGPEGAWRADVLASDPAGSWRMALEAQLSPITPDDIAARAERMQADGVPSVWFSDRYRPPWLGRVPSVRVKDVDGGGVVVVEGLAKFSVEQWEAGPQVPLAEFLRWVFASRVVSHRRRAPVRSPLPARRTVWTAPQYAQQEAAYLEAEERRKRLEQEEKRSLQEERVRWEQYQERLRREDRERARARGDHQGAIHALLERQAALEKPAFEFVLRETGVHPFVEDGGAAEFAMGVPMYVGLTPYGVICPVASRVAAARDRLAALVVFVASEGERRRIAAQARPGQRIEVLDGGLTAVQSPRPPAGQDTLPLPDAIEGTSVSPAAAPG